MSSLHGGMPGHKATSAPCSTGQNGRRPVLFGRHEQDVGGVQDRPQEATRNCMGERTELQMFNAFFLREGTSVGL